MRNLIINTVLEMMSKDQDIFFLTGDMGINLVEPIQSQFPTRFLNVGIAEQNLIGVSAGLANLGYRLFAYTISNFLIHRCLEQIRNDISLHDYPITLVSTSTGFDNSPLGPTHHIVDDWGMLKSFSNFKVYCPSSVSYAKNIVPRVLSQDFPTYIRVPKGNPINPDSSDDVILIGSPKSEVAIVTYGGLVQECLKVHEANSKVAIIVINQIFPLDEDRIIEYLGGKRQILVVEDHVPKTGLYGSLCELMVRANIGVNIEGLGPTEPVFEVGSTPDYYFRRFGLDSDSLLKKCALIYGD